MFITDPLDQLAVAGARGRELRAEAEAERVRPAAGTRRTLAASLRWAADRLDAAPAARRPASQS